MVLDHPPCPHCGEGPKHWGSPPLWRMSLRPMDLPSADHVRMFDWDDSVPMTLGVSGLRGWVETMICDWKGTESCDSSSKGRCCWCYCWCCCCDPLRYYCSLGGWSRSLDWWVRTAVDFAEVGRDANVRYWYRQYDSIRHSSSWYESHHPWWWRFLVGDNVVVMKRSPSCVICWYNYNMLGGLKEVRANDPRRSKTQCGRLSMRRNKSNHKGEMFDPFTSNNGSKLPSGCNVCVYLFIFARG